MAFRFLVAASKIVGVDPTEKLALIVLADHANEQGVAWPALPTIARMSCVSKRQAIRVLQLLKTKGLIDIDVCRGRLRSNRYTIHLDAIEKRTPVNEGKVSPTSPFDAEKVTPTTPFNGQEKVSPASPFDAEKVSPMTRKGDAHDTEMVSPMSPDPISNPVRSKEKNSGAARHDSVSVPDSAALPPVMVKLAHEVFDKLGEVAPYAETALGLKVLCGQYRVVYQPHQITAALDSALAQRRPASRREAASA